MLPRDPGRELNALAARVVQGSARLSGAAHPTTRAALRTLLRAMNSYYSNRIEGQSTHPANIERALKKDFSASRDIARLQRIAVAHLDAEVQLEADAPEGAVLTARFASEAHRAMYGRLAPEDRTTPEGHVVEPGVKRTESVTVGLHLAPVPQAIDLFLARYEEAYRGGGLEERLVAIAAAHHRLAWIHPFLDGNGRTGRLVSHCALLPFSAGLWSICRGLARQREAYYAWLQAADAPRRGALDGRGNLTDEGLFGWCKFFLETCADQVAFMETMLGLDGIKDRIRALVAVRATIGGSLKPEVALPLHHVFIAGQVTRGEFKTLTGLNDRTAQRQLAVLLEQGLLVSDSLQGPVRFGLPLDALNLLLPGLYPEAATPADT